jgi:predicted small integral membrane protein|tara:strand:+ start:1592 stop:2080 length:489 start_codon:yes stop_codon:yes gene_type:complete
MNKKEVLRLSKLLLLLTVAIYFTLVVFGNLTDYSSNYSFVEHVLSMDTTFEGNNLMYRAITNSTMHHIFYLIIILVEAIVAAYAWRGSYDLFKNLKSSGFEEAKKHGLIALLIGMLLWFFAFMTIGGEWFAMWQSSIWNGQDAAFRMFAIMGIIFIAMIHKD